MTNTLIPRFLSLFTKSKKAAFSLKEDLKIPAHIALIMDGNRRWADQKRLPRVAGYKIGLEALREIYKACLETGVKYLTIYAFSTENKFRPKDEVKYLEWLIVEAINVEAEALNSLGVRIRFMGRMSEVSDEIRGKIQELENKTKHCEKLNLQVMYNYGGRAEIVDAVKNIVELSKNRQSTEITEELISANLYMAGIPDPDLLVRTGGDMRISNFLLWELAYSEIIVTETLFPDFRGEQLVKSIEEYSNRQRRFGR